MLSKVWLWRTGDWRDSPWYWLFITEVIVISALLALILNATRSDTWRWIAGAALIISVGSPVLVLWRKYLRSGRGTHRRP